MALRMRYCALVVALLLNSGSTVLAGDTGPTHSSDQDVASQTAELRDRVEQLTRENERLIAENRSLRALLAQPARTGSAATASAEPSGRSEGTTLAGQEAEQSTGYWLTSSSNKRHNRNCRYFKNSNGRPCGATDGIACKICGG